jgi:hypothetical protein
MKVTPQSRTLLRSSGRVRLSELASATTPSTGYMQKSKYTARVGNIYFLSHVGVSLRWATQHIAHDELPANIKHLLGRLDRVEALMEIDDLVSCVGRLRHPANDRSGIE